MRSKISLTNLFRMAIALLEIRDNAFENIVDEPVQDGHSEIHGNAFEDIVDEAVQNGHSLVGDTSIGVDLLEDLIDVIGEAESRVFDVPEQIHGNAFEDIVDEAVQDGHSLVGDTSIGVDLLEDLIDVIGEAESRVYDVPEQELN